MTDLLPVDESRRKLTISSEVLIGFSSDLFCDRLEDSGLDRSDKDLLVLSSRTEKRGSAMMITVLCIHLVWMFMIGVGAS